MNHRSGRPDSGTRRRAGVHANVGTIPRPESIASVRLLARGLLPKDTADFDIGSADEAGARNVAGREQGDPHRPAAVVHGEGNVSGGRTHRCVRDRAPHDEQTCLELLGPTHGHHGARRRFGGGPDHQRWLVGTNREHPRLRGTHTDHVEEHATADSPGLSPSRSMMAADASWITAVDTSTMPLPRVTIPRTWTGLPVASARAWRISIRGGVEALGFGVGLTE